MTNYINYKSNKTINAYTRYTIYREFGKGTVYFIAFITSSEDVSLRIKIDDTEVIDFPNIEFFYNAGLTSRNKIAWCHVYDASNLKYGIIVTKNYAFNKKIEIIIINETESSITLRNSIVMSEVET